MANITVGDADVGEAEGGVLTLSLRVLTGMLQIDDDTIHFRVLYESPSLQEIILRSSCIQCLNEISISYQGVPNFYGIDQINYTLSDNGYSGKGGELVAFKTRGIVVIPVEDPLELMTLRSTPLYFLEDHIGYASDIVRISSPDLEFDSFADRTAVLSIQARHGQLRIPSLS